LFWLSAEVQVSNKPLNIGEEAKVQMPMKTVASLIIIVALGTMGYFQIIERLNVADTRLQLMEKDLEENTEFRIKWPRGQLGSLPADSEQYMMIEDLYKTTDKLNAHIENMALNKVNIEFLRKQMDKVLLDIEKLKDANREIGYKNGSYSQ
jgi:division protein CdvB (Snf7/Vps24/ESCRT-III family)